MAWRSRSTRVRAGTLVAWAILASSAAHAEDGGVPQARQVVEHFHRSLVALAAGEYPDVAARVAMLAPLVTASHDLGYIARFTLRRQWPELTEQQRGAFIEAFTDLSVMTYATRFESVTPDTFRISGAAAASRGRVQVEAAIHPPEAEPIPLSYLLHESDGEWRIINIIADGVSDLALKRAEYQRVLTEQSFEGLLGHLRQATIAMVDS